MNLSEKTHHRLDLRDVWAIVKKRKLLLVIPFMAVLVTVLGVSFLVTPIYESSTTILLGKSQLLSRSIESMLPGEPGYLPIQTEQKLSTIRSQILSSGFLARLIQDLKLDRQTTLDKAAEATVSEFPGYTKEEIKYFLLIDRLRRNIYVRFRGENLVEIVCQSSSPQRAADMASTLAKIFIAENLKYELIGVREALEFSDEQLAIYRRKLDESEQRLKTFRQQAIKMNINEVSTNSQNIREITSEADATRIELASLRQRREELKQALQTAGLSQYFRFSSSQLESLKAKLLNSVSDYTTLLTRYSWKDSKVLSITNQTKNILDQIQNQVGKEIQSIQLVWDETAKSTLKEYLFGGHKESFLKRKQEVLNQVAENLKRLLARQPDYEISLSNLEKEVESSRKFYDAFVQQAQGSQISQQVQQKEAESKYRILEPASAPLKPVKPNRPRVTLFGIALGLAVGLGSVIMSEIMDHSFRKVEEVEEFLKIKVIGTIPRIASLEDVSSSSKVRFVTAAVVVVLSLTLVVLIFKFATS
jgi:polysaccharide chain length determinant protein (PEP-CTERM system associated)